MKKRLLFAACIVFAGMVNAQDCTPLIDAGADSLGLNPNPPAGSVEGVPYDEVNTLVIPQSVDNTLTMPPGDSIDLCAIGILDVIGMPAGYTYEVWAFHSLSPSSNYDVMAQSTDTIHIFTTSSVTRVCIRIKNPSPLASTDMTDGLLDRDTAYVQIAVRAWADLGFGCANLGSSASDTFELHLAIKDAVYAGIGSEETTNTFAVHTNTPNPANDITYLNFTTPKAGDLTINVFDAVGRNVRSITGNSNSGKNGYALSTSDLKEGIYIYSITYNGKTISKKLIVSR